MLSCRVKILMSVLLFQMCTAEPSSGQTHEIGVYFDQGLTQRIVSVEAGEMLMGYLGVTGDVDRVLGWQGEVVWTDSLLVVPVDINGKDLNEKQFPEYSVQYSRPLNRDGNGVILGTVVVMAKGAGSLCVSGLNSANPSCVVEGDDGELIVLSGCADQSSATEVRIRETLQRDVISLEDVHMSGYEPFTADVDVTYYKGTSIYQQPEDFDEENLALRLIASEQCYQGTIQETLNLRLSSRRRGYGDYTLCRVDVDQWYWGDYVESAFVLVRVMPSDGIVEYRGKIMFPESVSVGERILVYGAFFGDVLAPAPFGMTKIVDGHISPFGDMSYGQIDVVAFVQEFVGMRSSANLYDHADLVVIGSHDGLSPTSRFIDKAPAIEVLRVMKGSIAEGETVVLYDAVNKSGTEYEGRIIPASGSCETCVYYLRYDDALDAYSPIMGHLGIVELGQEKGERTVYPPSHK